MISNLLIFTYFFFLPDQIASIFYYLCVVTLQYVAPILMCLYFALMYKTLGGYNWSDLFANSTIATVNANITPTSVPMNEATTPTQLPDAEFFDDQIEILDKTIVESAKELQSSFHGLKAVYLFLLQTKICKKFFNHIVPFSVYDKGVHNGCVSRFIWFCNVVDMLCLVCCILIRHGLSIIFYQILNQNHFVFCCISSEE